MADIFNRTITLGPTISGDLLRLTFGTDQGGMLVEQVEIQQERAVDVSMDIGTGNLVTILGIPRAYQAQLVGLVADATKYKNFIQAYGTGCTTASDLVLSVTSPVCTTPAQVTTYTLKNPRIIRIGATISKSNGYVYAGVVVLSGPAIEIS